MRILMRTRRWLVVAVVVLLLGAWSAEALVVTQVYTHDYILLYSMGFLLTVDHSEFVGTWDTPELKRLEKGSTLYLIAHSTPGFFGEFPPKDGNQVAFWLRTEGAPDVPLHIDIPSCSSAVVPVKGSSFLMALAEKSYKSWKLTGYSGCTVVDRETMKVRIVDPAHAKEFGAEQALLEGKYKPQKEVDIFVDEYHKKHGDDPPQAELARWAFENKVIDQFYRELLTKARDHKWLLSPGDGEVHASGSL
jgi:hypothetical protein